MNNDVQIVKLSSQYANSSLHRQTPKWSGQWGSYAFSKVGEPVDAADYWFVLDNLNEAETTRLRSGKVILLCQEPPDYKNYHPAYLRQFDLVVSCHKNFRHPNVMNYQQGLPWLVGQVGRRGPADPSDAVAQLGYDDFAAMSRPRKERLISTIVSTISKIRGHRKRQQFLRRVELEIPEIEVFGRGRSPVPDKKDALLPYNFHLALENSQVEHYWTEKLADSYLCHSFPIYSGAPNLTEYFQPESFLQIDINDPQDSILKIRHLLKHGLSEQQLDAMAKARDLILNRYNIYALMAGICENLEKDCHLDHAVIRAIRPEKYFIGYRTYQAAQRVARWTKVRLP